MEEIIDNACPGRVLLDFHFAGGIHLHDHSLESFATVSPEQFKERSDALPASSFTDPQNFLAVGFDNNRGIPVPFVEGKFVHADHLDTGKIDETKSLLECSFIKLLHLIPGQMKKGGNVLYREYRTEPRTTLSANSGLRERFVQPGKVLNQRPALGQRIRRRGTIKCAWASRVERSRIWRVIVS